MVWVVDKVEPAVNVSKFMDRECGNTDMGRAARGDDSRSVVVST